MGRQGMGAFGKALVVMACVLALAACPKDPANTEGGGQVSLTAGQPVAVPEITPEPVPEPAEEPAGAPAGYDEVGEVSFYGDHLHGRPTASGALYDTAKFTAAHRTLPFGSMVRVTNTSNGKSTIVRVNDRGPSARRHPERILDVSRAAAETLRSVAAGTPKMRVTLVQDKDGKAVNPQWLDSSAGHLEAPTAPTAQAAAE